MINFKPKIGIIGYGIVGQALAYGFSTAELHIYDKYKEGLTSFEDVARKSEFIFICLPTPIKSDESGIDLSIIEETVRRLVPYTNRKSKFIIIKSTVVPGTTMNFVKKYPKSLFAFNPEFLTEANYMQDFVNSDRTIIGAANDEVSVRIVALYRQQFPKTPIFQTDPTTAEMVKYMANCFFSAKVIFANEMYDLCQKMGIEYEEVKKMVAADHRIFDSHLDVTSVRGFGGKCLVAGTRILTNEGFKNIEYITNQDQVFDGDGFTQITGKFKRTVNEVIQLTARGRKIAGSPDHIHFFVKNNQLVEKTLYQAKVGEYIYVPQTKFNGTASVRLGLKPNNYIKWWPEEIMLDQKFARLLGLYCAEGCMSSDYTVIWSFGQSEEYLADEVQNILKDYKIKSNKKLQINEGTFGESRCWIVRVRLAGLQELFHRLNTGDGSQTKDAVLLSGEPAKSFIGGWLDGDGSYYDGTIMGHSESQELIIKIDAMLLRLGIIPQISRDGKKIKISMREDVKEVCSWTKRHQFDQLRYVRDFSYASPTIKKFKNGWAVKITSIDLLPGQTVYSIETKSHRYTANNILTHNCFPKDLLALKALMKKNKVDTTILDAVWKKNLKIRTLRDWEEIPFAVTRVKKSA